MPRFEYQLLHWVPPSKLSNIYLCKNPYAIDYICRNIRLPHIGWLSANPNARQLLINNFDQINFEQASSNPQMVDVLAQQYHKINWEKLSANPNGVHLLLQFPDRINWRMLSSNPNAIHVLKANRDKIDWNQISANPKAIDLINENIQLTGYRLFQNPSIQHIDIPQKRLDNLNCFERQYLFANPNAMKIIKEKMEVVDWDALSLNTHPEAIDILIKNYKYINWTNLSANPAAIELLKINIDKIDWSTLSANPRIFILKQVPETTCEDRWEGVYICMIAFMLVLLFIMGMVAQSEINK